MSDNDDICAICHDSLGNESLYELPECGHKFHTNCIMTWFRAKHDTCPLCNNRGVNSNSSIGQYGPPSYLERENLLKLYPKICQKSRKKNASKELKKDVEQVKKYQKKFEDFKKKRREWIKSNPENMSVSKIVSQYNKFNRKKWEMNRTLRQKKRMVAYVHGKSVINIIIPQKVIL